MNHAEWLAALRKQTARRMLQTCETCKPVFRRIHGEIQLPELMKRKLPRERLFMANYTHSYEDEVKKAVEEIERKTSGFSEMAQHMTTETERIKDVLDDYRWYTQHPYEDFQKSIKCTELLNMVLTDLESIRHY